MIVTYDTEFWDNGRTIELISFGMVAEDGRELYLVHGGAPWNMISQQAWLLDNVVLPHLPTFPQPYEWQRGMTWFPDLKHPSVVDDKTEIAVEVEHFLMDTPDPDLWAYYSATDHVVGYQLFGSMTEASRDHGWPMRTSCLKQHEVMRKRDFCRKLGVDENYVERKPAVFADDPRPVQDPATEHHALHDARHDMDLARWLGLC